MIEAPRSELTNASSSADSGWHANLPRGGCPECEGRELRSSPRAAAVVAKKKERSLQIA
jgi:hypothetical protein